MENIETNNAAYRLLRILTTARSHADDKPASQVWMSVLDVHPTPTENLFEKLILLRGCK